MALQEEFQHPNGLLKLSKISYQDFTFKLHEDYFVVGLSERAELHHWHYRNLAIITSHLFLGGYCVSIHRPFFVGGTPGVEVSKKGPETFRRNFFQPGFVFGVWYFLC